MLSGSLLCEAVIEYLIQEEEYELVQEDVFNFTKFIQNRITALSQNKLERP